jgi:hypothetical protein
LTDIQWRERSNLRLQSMTTIPNLIRSLPVCVAHHQLVRTFLHTMHHFQAQFAGLVQRKRKVSSNHLLRMFSADPSLPPGLLHDHQSLTFLEIANQSFRHPTAQQQSQYLQRIQRPS